MHRSEQSKKNTINDLAQVTQTWLPILLDPGCLGEMALVLFFVLFVLRITKTM
jgi:hypothetical protein